MNILYMFYALNIYIPWYVYIYNNSSRSTHPYPLDEMRQRSPCSWRMPWRQQRVFCGCESYANWKNPLRGCARGHFSLKTIIRARLFILKL